MFLTSCSTIKQLEIFSKPIERQPLALEDPVLPKLEDISLNEIKVGLRPAVFDGNPIIGPLEEVSKDIICNFGHYRNGILLAPISSQIISQYIFEENIAKEHKFFSPKRFNL